MSYIKLDSPLFIGVDETRLGFNSSTVVSAAFTQNKSLTDCFSDGCLLKAKDYLKIAQKSGEDLKLPDYKDMRRNGLMSYRWMRLNKGRFSSSQEIQHSYISYIVSSLNFEPEKTHLFIDAFENNLAKSKFLIYEILNSNGYHIPKENINICGQGDKQIPIINYADLIAFEVGLNNFKRFSEKGIEFPDSFNKVPIENKRLDGLPKEFRDNLEKVLGKW